MSLPRKLSLSNMQGGLASPREGALPSPRVRPGFDGVLSDVWAARRRAAEGAAKGGAGPGKSDREGDGEGKDPDIKEEEEDALRASDHARETSGGSSSVGQSVSGGEEAGKAVDQVNGQLGGMSISGQADGPPPQGAAPNKPPPGLGNLSEVEWSYLDPQGQVQGGSLLIFLLDRWPHAMTTCRTLQGGAYATLVQ